ncbi:MAG: DIP1984 family protein [Candidatus Hydrogenedentes bacterium]|nr:DIP1984 family protein [Candidatus Hydrogenedentota bacterium]
MGTLSTLAPGVYALRLAFEQFASFVHTGKYAYKLYQRPLTHLGTENHTKANKVSARLPDYSGEPTVKLAKALMLRAEAQNRLGTLRQRITAASIFQEGEKPVEDPLALLSEADRVNAELEQITLAINLANVKQTLKDGRSLTAAMAARDRLRRRHTFLNTAIEAASPNQSMTRYSAREIRWVTALDVPALRRQLDDVAAEIRELNAQIQEANWNSKL